MPRYAVKIEYNGAPFVGWQAQTDLPSVQAALETAIKKATGQELRVTAAGRTDTGVHALGQVASFDLEKAWEPFRLSEALNYHLKPLPVAITATSEVGADFSARFDAQERFYTYRVLSRRAPAVLDQGWVWQVIHSLDVTAMQEAANHLIGKHDFTTFRSVQCQALSPIKTMNEITIESETHSQGMLIKFHLRAQSFLHNQVRSIVGSLVHVGRNKWRPDDMRIALEAADRSACGQVAPPQGLFLMDVRYPTDIFATATPRTTN